MDNQMSEDRTTTPELPQFLDLVSLYLAGDQNAVKVLDTALTAALDLSTARNKSEWDSEEADYLDVRQELDEAIDDLAEPFQALGLASTRFASND